jgi:DNA polymerase elongation subunit (family B)
MEELDLIGVLDENIETKKVKLSDKYKNVFTKEDAKDFIKHTESMRKEWENT